MSSVNLASPPNKLVISALGIVVILHVLTALLLATVKSSAPVAPPPKMTPPIEIEFLTLSEPEPAITEVEKAEPVTQVQSQPDVSDSQNSQSQVEPVTEPKEPVVEETEPTEPVEPEVVEPKVTEPKVTEPEVVETVVTPLPNANLQTSETSVTKVVRPFQHEVVQTDQPSEVNSRPAYDSALTPHSVVPQTASNNNKNANNKGVKRGGPTKLAKSPPAPENVSEEAEIAAQVPNNEPVAFGGSDASWARRPNFEGISDEALTLTLTFRVDKQGNMSNIEVKGSSNRNVIRDVKRRLKRSKLNPFIKNGVPVVGIVSFAIAVES